MFSTDFGTTWLEPSCRSPQALPLWGPSSISPRAVRPCVWSLLLSPCCVFRGSGSWSFPWKLEESDVIHEWHFESDELGRERDFADLGWPVPCCCGSEVCAVGALCRPDVRRIPLSDGFGSPAGDGDLRVAADLE